MQVRSDADAAAAASSKSDTTHSVRATLGQPLLHIVVGIIFLAVWSWPLLTGNHAGSTWGAIYVTWGLAIVVSFVLSRGRDPEEDPDELDEEPDEAWDESVHVEDGPTEY